MYEKNIVGVYNFLSEFPIHQHTVRGEKRIDPVNYAAQRPHSPGASRGEIDPLRLSSMRGMPKPGSRASRGRLSWKRAIRSTI